MIKVDPKKVSKKNMEVIYKSLYDIHITVPKKNVEDKIVRYLNNNVTNIKVKNKKLKLRFNLNHNKDMQLKDIFNYLKKISKIRITMKNKSDDIIFSKEHNVKLKDYEYELSVDSDDILYIDTVFKKQKK